MGRISVLKKWGILGLSRKALKNLLIEVMFNRYYRGTNMREKPEGSGLGLAIAKQIITLHNGNIAVKSKRGEGTRFTIVLPFVDQ